MIKVSKTGHQITKGDVVTATKWDVVKHGFCGSIEYKLNGKRYLNPVTKPELEKIQEAGVKVEFIHSEYNGTY